MAPAAPEVRPVPADDSIRAGIRAILLGPPGSGKGTQVSFSYSTCLTFKKNHAAIILIVYYIKLLIDNLFCSYYVITIINYLR